MHSGASRSFTPVSASNRSGFVDDNFAKIRAFGLKSIPDPDREILEGGVFQPGDIVEITVIELLDDFLGCLANLSVIVKPAHLRIDFSFNGDFHTEAVAMDPTALMPRWHMREGMSGFEGKIFSKLDFHNYNVDGGQGMSGLLGEKERRNFGALWRGLCQPPGFPSDRPPSCLSSHRSVRSND